MKMLLSSLVVAAVFSATPAKADKQDKKAAAKPAATAPTSMKIDAANSEVKWEGSKKLIKSAHTGTVKVQSGEIQLAGEEITGGTIVLDMKSISNADLKSSPKDQAKLEGHLKSPDFFDVEKYPTANFKITAVKALKNAKDGLTHEITGDLSMKGKTHPVTFPVTITRNGDKAEAQGVATVDRTKYEVRYGSGKFFDNLGDKVINDEIKLDIKVVASK